MIQKAASIPWSEGDREYAQAVQEALSEKSRLLGKAMSYQDFTLQEVRERFGLKLTETPGAFARVPPRPVSKLLTETLHDQVPLGLAVGTESARKELLVSPILVEVRRQLDRKVSLFSGISFFVDEDLGLAGFPDFLLSRSPEQITLEAPALVVVEAKKEDVNGAIPQCLAEMVAARMFNERRGARMASVYGAVTTGDQWLFMSLTGDEVTIDLTKYYINEVARVVGIIVHMLTSE